MTNTMENQFTLYTISFDDFCIKEENEYKFDDYFTDYDCRLEFEGFIERKIRKFIKLEDGIFISFSYTVSFFNKNIFYHCSIIYKTNE